MAEALIFHYREQHTLLCRANPLIKFLTVLILCLVLIRVSLAGVLLIALILCMAAALQKLPITHYKRELRFFAFLMAMILLTEYLAHQDILLSAAAALRFFCIILCGMLVADATAPDDLARSLGNLLDRIPFVQGSVVASTIELTLSILPLIFDASLEVVTARKARLERRRNPYTAITSLSSSIFSLLLDKAQELSLALEARNFDPARKRPGLPYSASDFVLLVFTALVAAGALML
ncbi:MAG: energy-coupling factor transporter transmembrane component T [Sphaerochaeta sp.]